jgi:hypothetical protein
VLLTADRARWLLLIHQLPQDPAYLRVKVGRRLTRVGAILLKNSVYILPKSEAAAEDFQWIHREIVDAGGEATVIEAQLVEGLSDREVEAKFRATKDAEYEVLAQEARSIRGVPSVRRKRPLSEGERVTLLAEVARCERRLEETVTTDFFGASGREVVARVLADIRHKLGQPAPDGAVPHTPSVSGRTWVTRVGVGIDRIASAWLIRRFIDEQATFKFVPARGYAQRPGELRFDMFEAEYSHVGDCCTFETLLREFHVEHPGTQGIAEVVHDVDVKDAKFARPETAGVAACIAGICALSDSDEERIARGSALFETLLSYFSAAKESP